MPTDLWILLSVPSSLGALNSFTEIMWIYWSVWRTVFEGLCLKGCVWRAVFEGLSNVEGLLKVCWRSVEGLLKVCWMTFEGLLKVCWRSVEVLLKVCWRTDGRLFKGLFLVWKQICNGNRLDGTLKRIHGSVDMVFKLINHHYIFNFCF